MPLPKEKKFYKDKYGDKPDPMAGVPIGKVPPQSLDVERTVLGSMLIDADALDTALELLSEECFYATNHKYIYTAILEMSQKSVPVDLITLTEELRKREWLEAVGSEAYLSELVESVATAANIAYHSKILSSKAILRQLISISAEIGTDCFNSDAEAREVLDKAESKIFKISEQQTIGGFESLKTLLPRTFEEIERYGQGGGMAGTMTGFHKLDEMTTGFKGGDLIIVAGRPAMGKTSFVLSVALNTALRVKPAVPVAIFSLEMSKAQLVQRMLSAEAKVEMHRMRSGKLAKRELNVLGIAAGPLWEAPIFIDDTPAVNVLEVRTKCRRLKMKHGLGLIVIDYLQLMGSSEKVESRQNEISQISRGLKGIAKELDCPIIALSQLSRAVEQRTGDHRPQLSDLRESGAIEQDADMVMFVFREFVYKPEEEELRRVAEIIIGKQRNGPIGTVKVAFIPEFAHFENLDEIHTEERAEF
jgi:replicative DNA helicase